MVPDSHTHLDMLKSPVVDVMATCLEAGVSPVITIGIDLESSRKASAMAEAHEDIYASAGIHPNDTAGCTPGSFKELEKIASGSMSVVAIGETGLDYYRESSTPDAQQEAFRQHIRIARETGKTLIVHDREAHEDVMRILAEEDTGGLQTVMHCFSGDLKLMEESVRRGYYISFAGPLTFKNAESTREVAVNTPLERLLVETDAPFLSPHPFRGKPNSPEKVRLVAEKLAELKQLSTAQMEAVLMENTLKAFNLPPVEH